MVDTAPRARMPSDLAPAGFLTSRLGAPAFSPSADPEELVTTMAIQKGRPNRTWLQRFPVPDSHRVPFSPAAQHKRRPTTDARSTWNLTKQAANVQSRLSKLLDSCACIF